jgi:3-oxoacyl-[acyl-carrier-protein] synthase III
MEWRRELREQRVEQAHSVVLSTGSYLPRITVKDEELTKFLKGVIPLTERWTGVHARRWASIA